MDSSFTGSVRLHSILLRTTQDGSAPKTLKVFTNKVGILHLIVDHVYVPISASTYKSSKYNHEYGGNADSRNHA